jgi:hypothetical protein
MRTTTRMSGRRRRAGLAGAGRARYVERQIHRLMDLVPDARAALRTIVDVGERWDSATSAERRNAVELAGAVTVLLRFLSERFGDAEPPMRVHLGATGEDA